MTMRMNRVRAVSALALALAWLPARAQQADVEAQWKDFLAKGALEDINPAVDAMDAVGYALTAVDKDKCKSGRDALARAQQRVPVSIAVQRAALLCAEATGDQAAAERAADAIGALAKYAFRQADRGAWPRPVRIVLLADAYALLATAGLEYKYELYTQLRPAPYFPLYVAATNPDTGVEKMVQFDYVDALQSLDRQDPAYGTPTLRMNYANSFIDGAAKRDELAAVDLKAVADAMREDKPAMQIERLRPAAQAGGLHAISAWLGVCARNPGDACGDGLVDALLPLVEAKHAYPTMLLATAYLEGIGVPRSEASAQAMLDAADKLWEKRGASVTFAEMQRLLHPGKPLAPFLRQRLQASAQAGNAAAPVIALGADIASQDGGYALTAADEALLASPDHNGLGQGLLLLSGWYEARDKAKSDAYLQRAAEANSAGALRILALRLRQQQGSRPPSAEAIAWLEKAANGGDPMAMRYLAWQSYMQGQARRAEDWVTPAAMQGDVEALFFLASLWSSDAKGMSGDATRAAAVYEALQDVANEGPRARRMLAMLALQGKGMAKDPAKARALLLRDAEAGNAESQVALGGNLLSGSFGKAEDAEGRKWLEKAVAAGSTDAMNQYGLWLHNHGNGAADRTRAVQLSRQAADKEGDAGSLNNTAWMLCTSKFEDVRKPADGMAYARKLEAMPDIGPGALDTLAACYAAAGEYPRAVELQQRVLDDMRKLPDADDKSMRRMQARLALYRAGKPYIEERGGD